ncbi:hypothetical protein HNQ50_001425 [Silvimonas terrae]|uniref:Uncharacterized protein n=1 Tax=Silvimonas terrae TaxID=300266 RepID=A0A840REC3_9NEIS|nr:hypothetical protein [Silvimonas terrae]
MQDSIGVSGDNSSIDLSNRSTNNIDASDHSITQNITTDGGAIASAAATAQAAIAANKDAFTSFGNNLLDSQKNALDFGVHVTDSAFDAVKASNDSTADIARIAMANNADAWNNAKTGNGLGDLKYVLYAFAGVFALMMWKRG